MSPAKKKRSIRLSDELWSRIGELAVKLGYREGGSERMEKSMFIRDVVTDAVAQWTYSPYVCEKARYFGFVDRSGNLFFRGLQHLTLNSQRRFLPCSIEQKPEKIQEYENQRPTGSEALAWLRSRWVLNHFSVWAGYVEDPIDVAPLTSASDRFGTAAKIVDLPIDLRAGSRLTREVVVGLADYCQRASRQYLGNDHIDVPIDVPTCDFKLDLLVDEEFYSSGMFSSPEDIPAPRLHFRSREGARYHNREMIASLEMRPDESPGHSARDLKTREKTVKSVIARFESFRSRVQALASKDYVVSDGSSPIPTNEYMDSRATVESLCLPEKYLFLESSWLTPPLGIQICAEWEKPGRSLVTEQEDTSSETSRS